MREQIVVRGRRLAGEARSALGGEEVFVDAVAVRVKGAQLYDHRARCEGRQRAVHRYAPRIGAALGEGDHERRKGRPQVPAQDDDAARLRAREDRRDGNGALAARGRRRQLAVEPWPLAGPHQGVQRLVGAQRLVREAAAHGAARECVGLERALPERAEPLVERDADGLTPDRNGHGLGAGLEELLAALVQEDNGRRGHPAEHALPLMHGETVVARVARRVAPPRAPAAYDARAQGTGGKGAGGREQRVGGHRCHLHGPQ